MFLGERIDPTADVVDEMVEDVQFPSVELLKVFFDVGEDLTQAFREVTLEAHPGNYKTRVAEDHHHVEKWVHWVVLLLEDPQKDVVASLAAEMVEEIQIGSGPGIGTPHDSPEGSLLVLLFEDEIISVVKQGLLRDMRIIAQVFGHLPGQLNPIG